MHAGRIEPEEEGLAVGLGLVRELERDGEDFVVHGLHPFRIECAGVLDLLLADLAPARLHGGIILVRRPAMDHVARADLVLEGRRIVAVRGILHRVQVIEVAEELVEPMHRGEEFVEVAQMVLAELPGGVAHGLERRGNRRRCRRHADG